MLIPKSLDFSEECIRCIYHPLMYSEHLQKLKREAFLPPQNSNKVSLLRLKYTSGGYDFCVRHGKSLLMRKQFFLGLAKITPKMVKVCEEDVLVKHGLSAEIIYAPMNNGEYIDTSVDIYTDDTNIDLPMHADLTYSKIGKGEVQTLLRMFANELAKIATFTKI